MIFSRPTTKPPQPSVPPRRQFDAALVYAIPNIAEEVARGEMTDDIELPDADINPDEAEPLPPDEPVKTDPIPEETE